MEDTANKTEKNSRIEELGSGFTKSDKGNIYILTIIGQIEGHQAAPESVKTTKYEHVLPLLAMIEESEDTVIDLNSDIYDRISVKTMK